jgi:hypothetical protein
MTELGKGVQFINGTDSNFIDISTEEYREYVFSDMTVRIESPSRLNISASGGHRVFDNNGLSHYIPKGWRHLFWKAKTGKPNFVA